MSVSLLTTLAAESHLAEGRFLHKEQTLIKEKHLKHRVEMMIIIIINHCRHYTERQCMLLLLPLWLLLSF